jgi:hypothetical protein
MRNNPQGMDGIMNAGHGESENVEQVTIRDIEQAVDEVINRRGLSGKLTTSIMNGVYPDDTLKISALGSDENVEDDGYYWAAIGFDEEDRSWLLGTTWYHHSNHSAHKDKGYDLYYEQGVYYGPGVYYDQGDEETVNDGFYWDNVSPDRLDEIGEDIISSVMTDLTPVPSSSTR